MKATINGVPVADPSAFELRVEVDPDGETMPPVRVVASGGSLEVNRSSLICSGTVRLHPFRAPSPVSSGSEEDDMAVGIVAFFQAAAKLERDRGNRDVAYLLDGYAANHDFCLAAAKQTMEDASK